MSTWAAACVAAVHVDTEIGAASIIVCGALVHIGAEGGLVQRHLVALSAGAKVAPVGIIAEMLTASIVLQALVDISTVINVSPQ
jgi:hypothetical protein